MSTGRAASMLSRAGQLACLCGEYFGPADRPWKQPGTASLAFGFALAVLAQALVAGVLPLAGQQVAPRPDWAGLPFAAMLLGAVAATVPASHLLDRFGRRAAFALGASLGLAGGLITAFALVERDFVLLCLGAFWLGIAQGFGLFYRHAAALSPGAKPSAAAAVLGAGVLAGFAGPLVANTAEALTQPFFLVGSTLAAAAVQLAALALAVTIPEPPVTLPLAGDRPPAARAGFAVPTAIAAGAWFLMTGGMAAAPLAMAGCGIGLGGISGAVALHLVVMYAPGLVVGRLVAAAGAVPVALSGLAMAGAGGLLLTQAGALAGFSLALALVGGGWGFAVSAATIRLHEAGAVRPSWLAAHDGICLLAALSAALLAGMAA